MSFPLSPVIVDLVIQDLESGLFEKIDFPITFYYHYVDNIVTAVPCAVTSTILDIFFVYSRLRFTIEIGVIRLDTINFLDTTILIHNNKIKFD